MFKVYGRVVASRAYYDDSRRPIVDLVFLAMSSILAGRQYSMRLPVYLVDKILRKVYSGKSKYGVVPPVEIAGVYLSVNSNWLTGSALDLEQVSCSSDMRQRNKQLHKNRSSRKCDIAKTCAICHVGRDKCSIAVRRKTKVKEEVSDEVRGSVETGVQ